MQLDDVLTELVTDSGDRLLRVAYQLTHDRVAAQDLVQEALLRVYRSVRRRGRAPEDWYAYLRRAVINEHVRTRRLRSSTEVVTDTMPERPTAGSLEEPDVSAFEDDIRRAMARRDDEAPRAGDLLRSLEQASRPRRRLADWYVPFTVAVAVAAVVVGSIGAGRLLGGHQQAPATVSGGADRIRGASCPARYAGQAPWVPARPDGVDGRSRLVPQQTPSSALICAYAGSNTATRQVGWALSGRRSLAGDVAGLAGQVTWQPRRVPGQQVFCTLMGGRQTNYLIRLTYPGGATIWVAATDEPNECVDASNGEFTSSGIIGPDVSRAFASGRWPAPQPVSCARPRQDIGRLGQDTAMVPAGSTSLIICATKAHTLTSGYQPLVLALNRLPTRPSTRSCSPSPRPSAPMYQLLFSYPQGPPVSVFIISGCYPEIDNLGLQSNSASNILPVIQQLLKTK